MKSMKLNTSAKYKNNKFQIKYLKYERYNMVLFATYSTGYNNDNVFLHRYEPFIYFNRTSRTLHYVSDIDYITYYGADINIRPLMIRFGINAWRYLTQEYNENNHEQCSRNNKEKE